MSKDKTMAVAAVIQMVRDTLETLRANSGDISEILAEIEPDEATISVPVAAQLLMQLAGEPEGLRPSEKAFYCQVADFMGPDYIQKLRTIAAFMDKVENFH